VRIVARDADLDRTSSGFRQIVPVRHAVDERNHEIEAGFQHGKEPPRRSTTHACCCGTTRIGIDHDDERAMKSANVTMAEPFTGTWQIVRRKVDALRKADARWRRLTPAIGDEQRRTARADEVHGVRRKHAGCRELCVPLRAAVIDAALPHPSIRGPARTGRRERRRGAGRGRPASDGRPSYRRHSIREYELHRSDAPNQRRDRPRQGHATASRLKRSASISSAPDQYRRQRPPDSP